MMKDIDFIKWMCEKAEGFEYTRIIYDEDDISHILQFDYLKSAHNWNAKELESWYFYPLLLQRAIEGVNRESNNTMKCKIRIDEIGVRVLDGWGEDIRHWGTSPNIDNSKEYCLKYIYEQEQNP